MAKKLGDFFQIYVAFSEYLNFTKQTGIILYFLCTWHSSGRSSTVSSCSKCEDRRISRSINQSCTPISLYSLGIKLISKLEGLDKFPIKIGQTFTFNVVNCHACGAMDYVLGGVRGCNFVLQSALNYLNLKWLVVEHVGLGLKRSFWKLPYLICKNDEAGVLACRFDTPYYVCQAEWNTIGVSFKKDHIAALYFILPDMVHGKRIFIM